MTLLFPSLCLFKLFLKIIKLLKLHRVFFLNIINYSKLIHTGEKQFVCPECDNKFSLIHSVYSLNRSQDGSKLVLCQT